MLPFTSASRFKRPKEEEKRASEGVACVAATMMHLQLTSREEFLELLSRLTAFIVDLLGCQLAKMRRIQYVVDMVVVDGEL